MDTKPPQKWEVLLSHFCLYSDLKEAWQLFTNNKLKAINEAKLVGWLMETVL